MSWFGNFIDWYHDNGLIPGIWKGITGQQSNEKINDENLAYQRERNAIEDFRYADETYYNRQFAEDQRDYERAFMQDERDYNRAFAENERAYNRALQQQLFEREDTAQIRQAQQLSAMGINPLSQQLNGADAGQVVSSSLPSSVSSGTASAPSASSRGGQPLKKQFTGQNMVTALSGLADTINGISTGQYTRDSLALQNDAQFLKNLKDATALGIKYYGPNGFYRGKGTEYENIENGQKYFNNKKVKEFAYSGLAEGRNANRELAHKIQAELFDTDSKEGRLIKDLGNLDFVKLAENILTKFATTADNVGERFGKHFGSQSLLQKFFSLFY